MPGFGFLRDVFRDPFIIHWELNRLEARSKDLPESPFPQCVHGHGRRVPGQAGTRRNWLKRERRLADAGGAALAPQPVDRAPLGSLRRPTAPPRTNASAPFRRARTAATLTPRDGVGTTLLFPCFIDGCGLFAGDVHFAQGGGEVCGTAIEMGAKVTLKAKIMPGMAFADSTMHFEGGSQLKHLAPASFYAVPGFR